MVISIREMQVRLAGSSENPKPLMISLEAAVERPDGLWQSRVLLECPFFVHEIMLAGADSLEALLSYSREVHGFLSMKEAEGYEVFQYEAGDLHHSYLWAGNPIEYWDRLEADRQKRVVDNY